MILFRLFCQFRFKIPWEFDKFVNMKSYFFLYFVQCMFRMESNERMRRRINDHASFRSLGEPFKYPEHSFQMRRKFFRSLWSQVVAQKLECLSEISTVRQSMILLFSRSFSRFLRYLAIGTSYDHDFFSDVNGYV